MDTDFLLVAGIIGFGLTFFGVAMTMQELRYAAVTNHGRRERCVVPLSPGDRVSSLTRCSSEITSTSCPD